MLYKEDLNNSIKDDIFTLQVILSRMKHIKGCNIFLKDKYNLEELDAFIDNQTRAIEHLKEV
jgi:hypothetical protein